MPNISTWLIDRTLLGATPPDQGGPGSDDSGGVLLIPKSSSITGTSTSYGFVSYQGHSVEESYLSTEMESVYSTAPPQPTEVEQLVMLTGSKDVWVRVLTRITPWDLVTS